MKNRTWSAKPADELDGHDPSPRRWWWISTLALLLMACLWFVPRPFPDQAREKVIGHPMPEIRLQGLTGSDRAIRLEDLAGSVVLINFSATWCGPCQIELPHLSRLREKFSSPQDFEFLAIFAGPAESADELTALRQDTFGFLDRIDVDIPTYADPANATFDRFYELVLEINPSSNAGLPTTIVLDRQGIIRGVWIGYAPGMEVQVEKTLSRLLNDHDSD